MHGYKWPINCTRTRMLSLSLCVCVCACVPVFVSLCLFKYPNVCVLYSGLGRLAVELAKVGLHVTGVEVSALQLSACYTLINRYWHQQEEQQLRVRFHIFRTARIQIVGKYQSCMGSKLRIIWKQTIRLYPYLGDPFRNEGGLLGSSAAGENSSLRFRAIDVPDHVLASSRNPQLQQQQQHRYLSFVHADFVSGKFAPRRQQQPPPPPTTTEEQQDQQWRRGDGNGSNNGSNNGSASPFAHSFDAVCTVFLLDAVEDVEALLRTIWHVLKPGGYWLNLGPLQWHEHSRLKLSLGELLLAIREVGFTLEPAPLNWSHPVDLDQATAAPAGGDEEGDCSCVECGQGGATGDCAGEHGGDAGRTEVEETLKQKQTNKRTGAFP